MRVSLTNNTKNKNHNGSCGFLFGLNLGYKSIPIQAYDARGNIVWECELDIYGKVRNLHGEKTFIPFRYQGQYEDIETGLYYNRFRYYSPDTGTYISKDPIGLRGNNPNFYAYVHDVNSETDVFGLNPIIVIGEGQRRVNRVARTLKREGLEVRTITDDWAREFNNYDPYIKELHEPQSIEYNRKWIKDRMAEGYDVYDIGGDGRNSPFYAAEHDEIRKAKYDKYYGYDAKNKKKYKMKLKCKS
ncbi:RHS repeat-associated core domain-containing protein [Tenacibaculum maritimum]|uniref:RHS repeat-associated core domain-containing protein n=1 Tax=Tenacibaculum maritimum TaxID=107401 RepID=UPI001330DEA9|nr:RHS repeat-associated core domain-containing protein [Tenacibaculum maritimum]